MVGDVIAEEIEGLLMSYNELVTSEVIVEGLVTS